MATRLLYPLYQRGNPQMRVFRTNYFLTLVCPGIPQPEDTVQFHIPMEMTRVEVKNYLESIYNVPVAAVRTRIQFGSNKQRNHKNQRIKKPDFKVAYVQLAAGQTFKFPDLFPKREHAPEPGSFEDIQKKMMEESRQKQMTDPRRGGITEWFGL
uniref:Large ribosomal subunit protein uL23m n=1 Tax=Sphenodon punctatus TaxID=8508 RepID=A0A8D0GDM0_SPHPU